MAKLLSSHYQPYNCMSLLKHVFPRKHRVCLPRTHLNLASFYSVFFGFATDISFSPSQGFIYIATELGFDSVSVFPYKIEWALIQFE